MRAAPRKTLLTRHRCPSEAVAVLGDDCQSLQRWQTVFAVAVANIERAEPEAAEQVAPSTHTHSKRSTTQSPSSFAIPTIAKCLLCEQSQTRAKLHW